jgi:hypothetical protein
MYYKIKSLYIKTFSWEYWPMWLIYFPTSFYYVYLSIKARSLFFFSASNPSIETGGMFFESKWKIFKLMPQSFYPSTLYVDVKGNVPSMLKQMEAAKIKFPIIAKPDRGEKGWCVKKINSIEELKDYRNSISIPFLIQEYVNHPLEFSIFYSRNPSQQKGQITSVTMKKMLTVTGDGNSTIDQLIKLDNRSFLQYEKLLNTTNIKFDHVLKQGEQKILVPYGNHVLGAMFLNYNHIIDEPLLNIFDGLSKEINGFYFGRFDLRCTSIDDLKMGKNISILELNGAGAQPAHIYDPKFSFFEAQYVLAKHYKMMFEAATENNRRGIRYMSYQSFKKTKKLEKAHKLKVNTL